MSKGTTIRLPLLFVAAAIMVANTHGQVEFESLQLKYEVEREKLNKPIVTLREQYKARLLELVDKYTEEGDLAKALAAKGAVSGNPDIDKVDSSMTEVARAQKIFLQQKASKIRQKHVSLIALNRTYTAQLSKLRIGLTKAGKLEQATAVDAEAKKIAAGSMVMKSIPREAIEWKGHFYLMYDDKVDWGEAMARCKKLHGHLVTITSKEENDFALQLAGKEYCWIGATDEKTEGQWRWVTDEPFTFKGWWPGRPDNANSREDYAVCRIESKGGGWGDIHGTFKCHFICEWEPEIP